MCVPEATGCLLAVVSTIRKFIKFSASFCSSSSVSVFESISIISGGCDATIFWFFVVGALLTVVTLGIDGLYLNTTFLLADSDSLVEIGALSLEDGLETANAGLDSNDGASVPEGSCDSTSSFLTSSYAGVSVSATTSPWVLTFSVNTDGTRVCLCRFAS